MVCEQEVLIWIRHVLLACCVYVAGRLGVLEELSSLF